MTQNLKKFGTNLLSNLVTQKEVDSLNHIKSQKNTSIKITIPNKFDGRITWNQLLPEVPNQSQCISCWAFATLFVFSTRLAIYTNGKYKLKFSSSKMIFCKNNDNDKLKSWEDVEKQLSSNVSFDFTKKTDNKKQINVIQPTVNSLIYAWQYLYRYGVCEEKCSSNSYSNNIYSSIQLFGESYDTCPNKTTDEMISHRIGGYYYVPGTRSKDVHFENGDELNIRRDIFHWGPACSAMKIFYDFLEWDGKGIYQWNRTAPLLNEHGHAVIIVGWGEENGIKYWIVCNTWGSSWGNDKGYFKIIRGVNNCEIEENVFNGYPGLPAIRLFLEYPIQYNFEDFIFRNLWGVRDNGYKLTTYEKIILRRKEIPNFEQHDYLYEKKYWPDFSKLIAGDLKTVVFNLTDYDKNRKETFIYNRNRRNRRNRRLHEHNEKIDVNFFLNVLIIFIIISIYVKHYSKK